MADSPAQSEHGDRTLSERLDRMDAAIGGGIKQNHVITGDYTVTPEDTGKILDIEVEEGATILVPPGDEFEEGAVIEIVNVLGSNVLIYATEGTEFRAVAGDLLSNDADSCVLRYVGVNAWILTGADLRWD